MPPYLLVLMASKDFGFGQLPVLHAGHSMCVMVSLVHNDGGDHLQANFGQNFGIFRLYQLLLAIVVRKIKFLNLKLQNYFF